jgi:hypothetical protein
VIVVHDVLGLTQDAEAAGRHLAREGWFTVAPFLFHEHGPTFWLSALAAARAELGRLSLSDLAADLTAGQRRHPAAHRRVPWPRLKLNRVAPSTAGKPSRARAESLIRGICTCPAFALSELTGS